MPTTFLFSSNNHRKVLPMGTRSFFSLALMLSSFACAATRSNTVRQETASSITPTSTKIETIPMAPLDPDPDHLGVTSAPTDQNQITDWLLHRFAPAYRAFKKENIRACDKTKSGQPQQRECQIFKDRNALYARRLAEDNHCSAPGVRRLYKELCDIAGHESRTIASK